MIPVTDAPERRLDKANLDGLCNIHHNGLKRKVENYARKMGQLELLPVWMKNPDTRPAQFQIIRYGPLGKPDERGERGEF